MNKTELGAALRALRLASGKEAKAVARAAAMSAPKLSKIETGRVSPSVLDVEQILTAVGVSDEVKAEYANIARAAATETTAWRIIRRAGLHKAQEKTKALEAQMSLLRLFQPALIPGLLQTPEYIRAVLGRHALGDEVLRRTMATRLERQEVLYDSSKDLRFIITEPVLHWRIVSPAKLAAQIDRIISVSRLPHVDIRLTPLDAPQTDIPNHAFVIRDDRIVSVETVHAEVVVTDPRDVALYVAKFEGFAATALAGDAMREALTRIRDSHRTH
ncbi:helix-turn-helix domain-containing protein [Uniformispora flossi]|uniref:helix-turn-helix domain-containing protein n=1 Tax=Uniformispora flossi TaxID=3390723 RepID=UPI003C2FE2D7